MTNLCPMWSPLYIHRRKLYLFLKREVPEILLKCSKSLNKNQISVLDVGCGKMPYKSLFLDSNICTAYTGADIEAQPGTEITILVNSKTQKIQTPDETYDLVVHFQVLEHVQNPQEFIIECHRVLRKGGLMLCTVPFMFEYHAVPRDFYRWTHEGLHQDIEKGGFEGIKIQPIETDWESLLSLVGIFISRKYGYFLTKPLFVFLNAISFFPLQTGHNLLPMTYAVIAKKTSN